ncbi:MAG: LOG family protein, partial [Rhodobacteraceae bacterium]|nr:LOG family protein [Paracoccaceae bacterium]
KKVMFMNCDAIIVLPGGAGSLDEFFEVLTWRQLGLHEKPIFLANINGYWDPLVGLVDHVISEGFADASLRDFIQVVDDLTTLEDGLVRAFS